MIRFVRFHKLALDSIDVVSKKILLKGKPTCCMFHCFQPKKKKEKSEKQAKEKDGKKRRTKDPNAPKRNQTAFFHWQNENRNKIRKEGDSVADTATRAGKMWKEMTDEDKKVRREPSAHVELFALCRLARL